MTENKDKIQIHFVVDSPFGYVTNGRDNWLYNVSRILQRNYRVLIHVRKTKRKVMYYDVNHLASLDNIFIKRYPFSDGAGLLYGIMSKLSFRSLGLLRQFLFFGQVFSFLKKNAENGDIIIGLNPSFEMLPGIMLKKIKKDIKLICIMKGRVIFEWTQIVPFLKKFFFFLERYFLLHSDLVFANGYDTQEYLQENYGMKTRIIYNGIDWNKFQRTNFDKKKLGKDEEYVLKLEECGEKIILMIGTVDPRKGMGYLIKIVPYLHKKLGNSFKIIIVGKDGGGMHGFTKLTKLLKVEDTILFLGEKKSIPFFLRKADVTAHLSFSMGGISHATLEAMAAGKPIVAWENPTYTQFLEDGKTALLVEEKNSEQLAEAILKLLTSRRLRQEMGENAREEAKKYDWGNVVSKMLKSLKQELSK